MRAVFQNTLSGLKRQINAVKLWIAGLQLIHYPQALQIVLKAAVSLHTGIESILTRVTKRSVTKIMGQGNGFDQVLVQAQGSRNRPPQLRKFERMRQTRAKQVAFMVQKYLRFVDQPAKRRGVHDAVAVALVGSTCWGIRLGEAPAARLRRISCVGSEFHFLETGHSPRVYYI